MAQNIHLIIGQDDYMTDRAASTIIERIVPENLRNDALIEKIDGACDNEETQLRSISECEASVQTPPFLEPFKVTWWQRVSFLPRPSAQNKGKTENNGDGKKRRKTSAAVLKRIERFSSNVASGSFPENQHLIITATDVLETSVFMKSFKPVSEVIEFETPRYAKDRAVAATTNVLQFAKELDVEMDPDTASALVSIAGFDSRTLLSELTKLKTYLDPGEKKITREAVDAVASPGGEEPEPWDLTDAIGARDVAKAIAVLSRYEDNTGNGIRLTNAVERYFRQLAVVKDAQSRGVQKQETLANAGVAMAPYALKKAYAAARSYSPTELRAARYRFLAVRERVVSSGDASWRSLLEKELVRALSRPRRAVR